MPGTQEDNRCDHGVLSGAELVNPYDDSRAKTAQVEQMFDSIAPAYDFMNGAMSFGMHRSWQHKALSAAGSVLAASPARILDIATGTGEVAFELARRYPEAKVTGLDLSEKMLDVARGKLSRLSDKSRRLISFEQGDCLQLRFADLSFDLVTVAYGVRNFEHLEDGLREMLRVLTPGGTICILELSEPVAPLTKAAYRFYSRRLIPFVGRIVSGDSKAYSYLPQSIAAAPQRDRLCDILRRVGFDGCSWRSMSMGAVTYYLAHKPDKQFTETDNHSNSAR